MAEDKNVIGILFGVKGGGDINGSSGKRIKKELSLIANAISLSVGVTLKDGVGKDIQNRLDKISEKVKIPIEIDFDGKKLDDIEKRLEEVTKKKATIKIDIDEGVKRATGANSRGSSNTTGATDGKKVINDFYRSARALVSFLPQTGKEFEVLKRQAEGLAKAARDVVEKNPSLRGLLEEKIDDVKRQEERYDARRTDRSEAATKSDFEAKIKKAMQLERQLASVTDETSLKFKRLKEEAEAAWEGVYAEWGKRGVTFQDGGALIQKDSEENEKFRAMLRQRESIRKEGDKFRQDKAVEKKLKEWIEAARKFAQATASGIGDLKRLEKAAKDAKVEVEGLIGEGNLDAHTEYQSVKDKIADMQSSADAKASAKADGNLQMRWERAVAGASGLNERYVDLIKNSREAREAIDALYAEINKGQMKIDDPIKNKNGEVIGKVTIADVTQQTQQLELLYKKTAATMSTLEAKSHTLGNKIKETFNSKVLQSFAYALVGLLTGALRKVYTNVVELDSAITDLQIATGKTREETTKLVKSYADLAKQLGATMTEVTEGADTWLRQGYDVAETTQLISDSMMLSKLGQLESAEASKALTSAMKGYKVEVEDALSIVDKFTAVDMAAATSAGDIATAMAETAASANVAGVSMDRLIGYISTVAEVTQDGAESVGNFYKTLFARMGNVKTGRFIDGETGERLNDVEGTLSALGIELRSSNDTFRDFGEVLDEVGAKWNSYTNVQQHAIATAFAGTRQQEKFIVLMENYGQAMEYANIAAESEGTATSKYNTAYLDSIEAKVNELTAAWQSLSMNLLDSDIVKGLTEAATGIVNAINSVMSAFDGAIPKTALMVGGISAAVAILGKLKTAIYSGLSNTSFLSGILGVDENGNKKTIQSLKDLKAAWDGLMESRKAAQKINLAKKDARNNVKAIKKAGAVYTRKEYKDAISSEENSALEKLENVDALKKSAAAWTSLKNSLKSLATVAVPMIFSAIISFVSTLEGDGAKIATIIIGIGGAIVTVIALINGAMSSNPFGLIVTAITGVIAAIKAIVDIVPTYEKLKEAAEEANAAWEEQANQLQETTDKIKELQEELQELKDVESPTLSQKSDIENLEKEIALLEQEQLILREKEAAAQREAETAAFDAWDQYINEEWGGDKAYASDIDAAFDAWDESAAEDKKQKAIDTITEMQALFGDFEYGNSQRMDELLDEYNKLLDRYTVVTQGPAAALEAVIEKGRYDAGIEAITSKEINKLTDINANTLQQWADNADIKKLFNYLAEIGVWDGGDYEELTGYIRSLVAEVNSISLIDLGTDIEAVSAKFDGLNNALKEVEENGVLSLETVKSLMEEAPSVLEDYFDKTLNGYTLKTDTDIFGASVTDDEGASESAEKTNLDYLTKMAQDEIDEYIDALGNAQTEFDKYEAGEEGYEQALKNVAAAQDNLNTKVLEWNVLLREGAIEEMTEQLESQQDALEEQLDTYKSLVDVRKDIIETYKEEQDYRHELERKQQNVSTLQAQLAAASLDNSAAGQARQRELREELSTAQEELDEYTLEHAIQDITTSMDNEYAEYEAYIKEQVNIIADKLDNISNLIETSLDTQNLAIGMSGSASEYVELKDKLKEMGYESDSGRGENGAVTSHGQFINAVEQGDWASASQYYSTAKKEVNDHYNGGEDDEGVPTGFDTYAGQITVVPGAWGEGIAGGTSDDDGDNGIIHYNNTEYKIEAGEEESKLLTDFINAGIIKNLGPDYDGALIGDRDIFAYKNNLYGYLNGKLIKLRGRWSKRPDKSKAGDKGENGFTDFINDVGLLSGKVTYHTGGFVGDLTSLKSNEEFAKLLKGEFVSTPAQMDNFMKNVLPQVTSYSTGATINNNSPLVTIQCGTIDDETLPKLTQMVDAAVAQIERNMENALTRRGYRSRA